jgi:ATP-dependent DNA ligase
MVGRATEPYPKRVPRASPSRAHWYTGWLMFIPPMLCTSLRDPSHLGDPRYVAEPKFDDQRAQIHVSAGRTLAAFSCPGRSLLTYPSLGWLREARWPVASVVLDGELCASTARQRHDASRRRRQNRVTGRPI